MEPNDSNAASDAVTLEQFMGKVAIYLGILAGDRYDTALANMPGASWDDPAHAMHATSGESGNADAG